jgi:alkaline phosphatase
MVFESFPNFGLSKTYNVDKQVPDSAGTATALFTGIKTQIGAICLNPASTESLPSDRKIFIKTRKTKNYIQKFVRIGIKTIIDWAQMAKKRTGIVTNTR